MFRQPLFKRLVITIWVFGLALILLTAYLLANSEDLQPWAFLPIVGKDWAPTPTRSPYPFTMDDNSPTYTENFANNAGCNWLGVAGQVFDLDGEPVPAGAYMVGILDPVTSWSFTGSAPEYGPSGWEIYLWNEPIVATYQIQLFTPAGTPVSDIYTFVTVDSCDQNLVLINFVQNH